MTEERPPDKVGGRYRIGRLIANSTMGPVWEGMDAGSMSTVAVKRLSPPGISQEEVRDIFLRELRVLKTIRHPNMESLIDVADEPTGLYLVLEFLKGRTFDAIMNERARLHLAQARQVLRAVCAAMQFAHDKGVAHGGLKPANIMLTDFANIKVMGFGIASGAGTLAYMPPDELEGSSPVADVYGLGVTLYEMVVGALPFQSLEGEERGYLPGAARVQGLPAGFDELVRSAVEPSASRRLKSAALFAERLSALKTV